MKSPDIHVDTLIQVRHAKQDIIHNQNHILGRVKHVDRTTL